MVPDLFGSFFQTSFSTISWTTQIYMVSFCVFMLPIIWWLELRNIKVALRVGSFLAAAAALAKCIVKPNMLPLHLVAQFLSSMSNNFVFMEGLKMEK